MGFGFICFKRITLKLIMYHHCCLPGRKPRRPFWTGSVSLVFWHQISELSKWLCNFKLAWGYSKLSAGRKYWKSEVLVSIWCCILCIIIFPSSVSYILCFSYAWSSKWQVGNCLLLLGQKADELRVLTWSDHY